MSCTADRAFVRFAALLLPVLFAGSLAAQNLHIRGVRVTTGADEKWTTRDVVVIEGRVRPAGTAQPEGAQVVDLGGNGYLLPGLVDAHGHLANYGRSLSEVNLVGLQSYQEVIDRVRMKADGLPKGTWILGRGWDQNDWADKALPSHEELSSVVPDHPVALTRIDGHALLANFAAMQVAGVGESTESPPGGEILEDDGLLTGVFVDRAMELIGAHVPEPSREQIEKDLLAAQRECLRFGLTCVHDAGMDPKTLEVLRSLHTRGFWGLRVYAMLPASATDEIKKGPWQTVDRMITVRAVKSYADGALGSRGAALFEPYSDRPGSRGLMLTPPAGLMKLSQLCADHGFQLCVHAIGDRANRAVLDAYARTDFRFDPRKARFRIEHAQVVHPDDFQRFGLQRVIPSMQPTHLTSDMPWAPERLGPERIRGAYAWKSFLDKGLPLPFGSDFPVESADPLKGFYAAATTKSENGAEPEWRPEQKLSREQILAGFTRHAAYASFSERDFGTVEPGKVADFTVFDRDLMTCPDDQIQDARVLMTVVGGRVLYQKPHANRPAAPLSSKRVRAVLEHLASDELAGRDSPSAGLDAAAQFIEGCFGAVGIWPAGDKGTFFHHYELPGVEIDSDAVRVRVEREGKDALVLEPGADVRLWRPGRPFDGKATECKVTAVERIGRSRSRRPHLMICSTDSPLWAAASGKRTAISRRMRGSPPVLLVREGLLEPGEVNAVVTVPEAKAADVKLRNVVGKLPGNELRDEYVLVTAHYDHVGIRPGAGDGIFNGADDNATGTTGVITLAESIARSGMRLKRTVVFVCFSAEEKGLRGSQAFVDRQVVPLDKIAAVVNLEMLGRPQKGKSHYAWITGRDLSDFSDIAKQAFDANSIELIDFKMASQLFYASDNLPFARAGVVAHSISAGELHDDYHGPDDETDRIDVGHMTAVLQGIRDFVVELANRDERPAYNEKGLKAIKGR